MSKHNMKNIETMQMNETENDKDLKCTTDQSSLHTGCPDNQHDREQQTLVGWL